MGQHETIVGGLVLVYVASYVYSLRTGTNKTRPGRHVLLVLGGALVVFPYLFQTSPAWYGVPMQLMVNVLVLVLDWFSFHEDKTRFSEENLCLTGPCRRNAMITGHLAHWGDVVGVALLLASNADPSKRPLIVPAFLVYGLVGSRLIHDVTKDGSVSDLRGVPDDGKCAQARIMRDGWRGCLNDLISVLGVMVAWQGLFACGDGRCRGLLAPLKVVRSSVTDAFEGAGTNRAKGMAAMRVALTLLTTAVPTYSNYVNTAAQHGQLFADTYGLPACFDD